MSDKLTLLATSSKASVASIVTAATAPALTIDSALKFYSVFAAGTLSLVIAFFHIAKNRREERQVREEAAERDLRIKLLRKELENR